MAYVGKDANEAMREKASFRQLQAKRPALTYLPPS